MAAACITIGGIGTILAVSAVFLFLASVVVPLFQHGDAKPLADVPAHTASNSTRAFAIGVDEYRVAGWTLDADGVVRVFRADTGDSVATLRVAAADSLAAASFDVASRSFALGLSDGSLRFGRIVFRTDFPDAPHCPRRRPRSRRAALAIDGGVVQGTPTVPFGVEPAALIDLDAVGGAGCGTSTDHMIDEGTGCRRRDDDTVAVCRAGRNENEFTGEVSISLRRGALPPSAGVRTERVLVAEAGSMVYAVDAAGHATLWDTRDVTAPKIVARADLVESGRRVTALSPLLGRTTILVGADDGSISTWFRYAPEDDATSALARAQDFDGDGVPVTTLTASARERVFLAGYGDGRVRILQATSAKRVVDFKAGARMVTAAAFAPKSDGLALLSTDGFRCYDLDLKYPEVTASALFRPVWYEGYPRPEHVWQSSAGTDDFEPKLGMWPLVFGTLKATFYSLLFGVPLALLAAIFTSEFVSPGARPRLRR